MGRTGIKSANPIFGVGSPSRGCVPWEINGLWGARCRVRRLPRPPHFATKLLIGLGICCGAIIWPTSWPTDSFDFPLNYLGRPLQVDDVSRRDAVVDGDAMPRLRWRNSLDSEGVSAGLEGHVLALCVDKLGKARRRPDLRYSDDSTRFLREKRPPMRLFQHPA